MKTITKITERKDYRFQCEKCSREFDSSWEAIRCENKHAANALAKHGDFVWFATTKDAQTFADANYAYFQDEIKTPGWYYPDLHDHGDGNIEMYLETPENMIKEWEEKLTQLQKDIQDAKTLP